VEVVRPGDLARIVDEMRAQADVLQRARLHAPTPELAAITADQVEGMIRTLADLVDSGWIGPE
jgi:hypothetical protein